MLNWRFLLIAVVIFFGANASLGQDHSQIRTLQVSLGKELQSDVPIGTLFGKNRCDDAGNVYVRVSPIADAGRILRAPVFRIKNDGTSKAFDLQNMPGTEGKDVSGFVYNVDKSGGVHYFVRLFDLKTGAEDSYLVAFGSDGSYRSRIEVDKRFRPTQIVPLANGSYFLAGLMAKEKNDTPQPSFSVLLDSTGKLIRDLKRVEDDNPPKEQDIKGITNRAIEMGDAQEGPDGRLYLISGTLPTVVRVLSPTGEQERQITLETPFPEFKRGNVFLTPGKITAGIIETPRKDENGRVISQIVRFVSYDAATGEPISIFDVDNFKGPVACFDGENFKILRVTPTGKFAIISGAVGK